MELSLRQKKLLKLLCINARFSNEDIAESLGVSPDTVKYQIRRLVKEMQLGNFQIYFNPWMIGYQQYYYLARLKDVSALPVEKLKALPYVTFIMHCVGKYDLQLFIQSKNDDEFRRHLATIQLLLHPNVQDYVHVKLMAERKWTHLFPPLHISVTVPTNQKNFIYRLNKEEFSVGTMKGNLPLDETDLGIIRCLLKNARASYFSIAEELGVSHEVVRYRIRGYVESRFLLNIGMFPAFRKFGYFAHYLLLRLGPYDEKAFDAFVKTKQNIIYVAEASGPYNCLLYTIDRDPDEFAQHVREIKEFFKDAILDLELIYYEKEEKNLQFPMELLEGSV